METTNKFTSCYNNVDEVKVILNQMCPSTDEYDRAVNYFCGLDADRDAEIEEDSYHDFMMEELRLYNYSRQHGMA